MLLDNFAKQLSFDLDMTEKLAPDGEGAYTVPLDADIKVKISWLEPGFYFEIPIAIPPPEGWKEELLLLLLLANLMEQGTGGGALALDEAGEQILLTDSIPGELTYAQFRDMVERVANFAEYWKMKVDEER